MDPGAGLTGTTWPIDRTVGLDRLALLHVNEPKTAFGAGLDRHENPALQGLPAVLEVPGTDNAGPDAHQLAVVRRLHAEGLALRSPCG